MGEWILPTLSQVLSFMQGMSRPSLSVASRQLQAEHQWTGAVAALEALLETVDKSESGLVLSGPFPILSHSSLLQRFNVWAFAADPSLQAIASFFQLPPSSETPTVSLETSLTLPLLQKQKKEKEKE